MQSTGTCTGTWTFSTGTGNKVLVAKKKIFLCCNRVNLNKLVYPAIRALSVPAASSAVQRVSATVVSFWDLTVVECRINYCQTLYIWSATNHFYHTDQQIGLVVFHHTLTGVTTLGLLVFHHTLCLNLKFIGSNCSFFNVSLHFVFEVHWC